MDSSRVVVTVFSQDVKASFLGYTCTLCGQTQTKRLDPDQVLLILKTDATCVMVRSPEEFFEGAVVADTSPMQLDELIELNLFLDKGV